MVIKLVKWAFDLGYKTAELKYYHALQKQINSPLESQLLVNRLNDDATSKEQRNSIFKRMEVDQRVSEIVDSVFKPFHITRHEESYKFEP